MDSTTFGPYALCGWRVHAAIPLPELPGWKESASAEAPIAIELGGVQAQDEAVGFVATSRDSAVLNVPGVARFEISDGRHVLIRPTPDADPLLIRGFFYGSVLAVLCYMHGLLPLHGAAIQIGDRAVVFSGSTGAGKSTMATALARRGHPLLCDDICAIDLQDPVHPRLWPAFPRVKLLPDVIEAFQLGSASVYSRAALGTKGHFGMASIQTARAINGPVPVAAIYALDDRSADRLDRVPLKGKAGFAFLETQTHRASMGRELGLGSQIFRQICSITSAIPVYRLDRVRDLNRVDDAADLVEQWHDSQQTPASSEAARHAPSFEKGLSGCRTTA